MTGSTIEILVATVLSIVGIGAVTAGIAGYWSRRLGLPLRLFAGVFGVLAMPLGFLPFAEYLHWLAAALLVLAAGSLMLFKSPTSSDAREHPMNDAQSQKGRNVQ